MQSVQGFANNRKNPGVKFECLSKAFGALFPGQQFSTKNAVGIYTPDEIFKLKRAVCFSQEFISLSAFGLDGLGAVSREPVVWGVCGQKPTRTIEAEDSTFLLCYRLGKQFISQAIVYTVKCYDETLRVVHIDCDTNRVTQFLECMKAETAQYSQARLERRLNKRRQQRQQQQEQQEAVFSGEGDYNLPAKKRCVPSPDVVPAVIPAVVPTVPVILPETVGPAPMYEYGGFSEGESREETETESIHSSSPGDASSTYTDEYDFWSTTTYSESEASESDDLQQYPAFDSGVAEGRYNSSNDYFDIFNNVTF